MIAKLIKTAPQDIAHLLQHCRAKTLAGQQARTHLERHHAEWFKKMRAIETETTVQKAGNVRLSPLMTVTLQRAAELLK